MKLKLVNICLFSIALLLLSCFEGTGPSATENVLAGAVNSAELIGVSSSDIQVYLVEFQTTGMARIDSVVPNYAGEYSFVGFDFGNYGVEASTYSGFYPYYYGFRDGDRNGVFNSSDAILFSSYGHVNYINVPLYGGSADTIRYESEPNDDAFGAQNLGIIHANRVYGDVSFGGFTTPDNYTGDLDLFRFQSVWTGYMTIELSWPSSADLDMYLYDSGGYSVLARAASSGLSPERLYKSVYRDEEFILFVASVDNPSSYIISIRID